jgi:hypothetical protein
LKVRDLQAGFKGLKGNVGRKLFKNFKTVGYAWDVELLLKARKKNVSIKEYPVKFFYRKGSKLKFFTDWFFMLIELLKLKKRETKL